MNTKLPVIGFSLGDYHGIGIEIFLKYLNEKNWESKFTIVFYGPVSIIKFYANFLNLPAPKSIVFNSYYDIMEKVINISSFFEKEKYAHLSNKIQPGKIDASTAPLTLLSLETAVEDCKKNKISALVTLPINKDLLLRNSFDFPGHTEYLQQKTKSKEVLMLMYHSSIKVATLTGHIPLKKVTSSLNFQKIINQVILLNHLLKKKFNISHPVMAMLGVNPHAGENGKLGDEEIKILKAVIDDCERHNINLKGPFPADGFFGSGSWKKYDAILATYHDQGLIPFKLIAFDSGVNYTCGLPIIRTSPAHGTAYALVGKNVASYSSLSEAIDLAIKLIK